MKLYIKQKVFTITPNFTVKDSFETDVFTVVGEFFSLKSKLSVLDNYQREVARVSREIFTLLPVFTIELATGEMIQLKKAFTFLKPKYYLENTGWSLEGDFTGHDYQVVEGNRPVMTLSKHWFTWGDSYELDIAHEEDALLALCIALAIDIDLSDQNNSHSHRN